MCVLNTCLILSYLDCVQQTKTARATSPTQKVTDSGFLRGNLKIDGFGQVVLCALWWSASARARTKKKRSHYGEAIPSRWHHLEFQFLATNFRHACVCAEMVASLSCSLLHVAGLFASESSLNVAFGRHETFVKVSILKQQQGAVKTSSIFNSCLPLSTWHGALHSLNQELQLGNSLAV